MGMTERGLGATKRSVEMTGGGDRMDAGMTLEKGKINLY